MPLLDHFQPPVHPRHHWESFHSNWATRLADALNEKWLPPDFLAEEYTHSGTHLEIDIATFEQNSTPSGSLPNGNVAATLAPPAWRRLLRCIPYRPYSRKPSRSGSSRTPAA